MKDDVTRNLAPASIFVFATQGGKFVLTNRPDSPGARHNRNFQNEIEDIISTGRTRRKNASLA
jgi:hypothetical protein